MEEASENGKESSHSARANGMNEWRKFMLDVRGTFLKNWGIGQKNKKWNTVPHNNELE